MRDTAGLARILRVLACRRASTREQGVEGTALEARRAEKKRSGTPRRRTASSSPASTPLRAVPTAGPVGRRVAFYCAPSGCGAPRGRHFLESFGGSTTTNPTTPTVRIDAASWPLRKKSPAPGDFSRGRHSMEASPSQCCARASKSPMRRCKFTSASPSHPRFRRAPRSLAPVVA
jgi:hypothetical protein